MLLKQTQAIISVRLPTGLAKLQERDISTLLVRSKYFCLCFNSTTGLYRGDFAALWREGGGREYHEKFGDAYRLCLPKCLVPLFLAIRVSARAHLTN